MVEGRAKFRKLLQQISKDSDISVTILCLDGKRRDLEELGFDSMAQMLYRSGIEKSSVGLFSYITQLKEKVNGKVMKKQVREGVEEILQIFDSN